VTFSEVSERVPPRVSEPDVVTLPVRLKPLTVPVPATEVTVPAAELVPAPIAVRKDAASNALTVLSALKRGKVMAEGLTSVKTLAPTVVAPRFVARRLPSWIQCRHSIPQPCR